MSYDATISHVESPIPSQPVPESECIHDDDSAQVDVDFNVSISISDASISGEVSNVFNFMLNNVFS
jgi:hypothetical protein